VSNNFGGLNSACVYKLRENPEMKKVTEEECERLNKSFNH
jgi:hypothetical protein